jgi:hypothetical protein
MLYHYLQNQTQKRIFTMGNKLGHITILVKDYEELVSRKISGSFIEKSISTHGLNNIPKYPHMLHFR